MPLRPQTSGGEYGNSTISDFEGKSSVRSSAVGRGIGCNQNQHSQHLSSSSSLAATSPESPSDGVVDGLDFRLNDDISSVGSLATPADMVYGRSSPHVNVPRVPPPAMNRMAGKDQFIYEWMYQMLYFVLGCNNLIFFDG